MSSKGQIVIPQEARERCQLKEGDHFVVEDNPETQTLVLRKVKPPEDWFQVLLQCPGELELPPRKKQFYIRKNELVD